MDITFVRISSSIEKGPSGEYFSLLFANAASDDELLEAYFTKMMLVFHEGQHREALAIGIECLSRLGMSVPFPDPDEELVAKEFANFEQLFRAAHCDASTVVPTLSAAADEPVRHCIAELVSPAFFLPGNLSTLLSVRGATLALRSGFSRYCAVPLVWMAIHFGVRGNRVMASDVGRLALVVVDRFPDNDSYKAKVYSQYAAYVHWIEHPLAECVALLRSASQLCLKAYDYLYASFAAFHIPLLLLVSGESIESAMPEIERSRQLLQAMRTPDPMYGVEALQICFGALAAGVPALTSPPYFSRPNVLDYESRLQSRGLQLCIAVYYMAKIFALYHLERFQEALVVGDRAAPIISVIRNHFGQAWFYHSHLALAQLELWRATAADSGDIEHTEQEKALLERRAISLSSQS